MNASLLVLARGPAYFTVNTVSATPASGSPADPPTFWHRRVIGPISHQLTQGITPEKIALTLAVGSALGLFPLPASTLLCLIVGIVLRLNQPCIQIVNGMCTPLHIPAIIGLIRLGNWIFGMPRQALNIRAIDRMFWVLWDTPRVFLNEFGTVAWHAVVAWAVLAPFWIMIVYTIAVPVLREVVRLRVLSNLKPPAGPAAS